MLVWDGKGNRGQGQAQATETCKPKNFLVQLPISPTSTSPLHHPPLPSFLEHTRIKLRSVDNRSPIVRVTQVTQALERIQYSLSTTQAWQATVLVCVLLPSAHQQRPD